EVVQIACHEACSNAIEHGYSFGEGSLSVDAELDASQVILTIRDDGGWVERPNGNLPYRGNGLPLMEAVMDSGARGPRARRGVRPAAARNSSIEGCSVI